MATDLATIDTELANQRSNIAPLLPEGVAFDRFKQVTLNALQRSPDLMQCDQASLFAACRECAQDGLIPDGKEAALVKFGQSAAYMPMVQGLNKLARNSGELTMLTSQVVYDGDEFQYWIDDEGEHLTHRPNFDSEPGNIRCVYAMARTNDGERYVEVLRKSDVDKIRGASRSSGTGPWKDWYDQMARKSAIRRLFKRLPRASERLTSAVERDDRFYDFDQGARDVTPGQSSADVLRGLPDSDQGQPEQPQPKANTVTLYTTDGTPVKEYSKVGSFLNAVEEAMRETKTREGAQAVWTANAEALDRIAQVDKHAERVAELAKVPAELANADTGEAPGW